MNDHESPVKAFVDTLYLECRLPAGRQFAVPSGVPEIAVYVVSGEAETDNHELTAGTMAVGRSGATLNLEARTDCRLMVLGGEPVGHREIWWNFVAPTFERIEQAKDDWQNRRFDLIQGDEEFIPLPDQGVK